MFKIASILYPNKKSLEAAMYHSTVLSRHATTHSKGNHRRMRT